MLLPRFTIRALLAMLTVCAFICVIAGMAVRGHHWAWGVTIGLLSIGFTLLVHVAWFGVVWTLAQMQARRAERAARRTD
jgi:hypothetical protein